MTTAPSVLPGTNVTIQPLARVFEDQGQLLNDPHPAGSLQEAINVLAMTGRPYLLNAELRGPNVVGDKMIYTLHRQVGTKGATPGMTTKRTRALVANRLVGMRALAGYAAQCPPQVQVNMDSQLRKPVTLLSENDGRTPLVLPSAAVPWIY